MTTKCYRHEGLAKRKCAKDHEISMKITQLGIAGHYSDTIHHKELYLKINLISIFGGIRKSVKFGIAEVYSFQHFHNLQL